MKTTKNAAARKREEILETIARNILRIETLKTRKSDRLDFHVVAVWNIECALGEAFEAGRAMAKQEKAR